MKLPFVRGHSTRSLLRCFGGLLILGVVFRAGYLGVAHLRENFHTVVAGELYRSAQPSPQQIAQYSAEYGIRTIVNLRGENSGAPWYDAEVQEATKLRIAHLDFRMSANRQLTIARAAALVGMLSTAKKPLLIHCEAGADRTGLAAALYLEIVKKDSEAAAEDQLSIWFGHISLPISPTYAMDRTFAAVHESLEQRNF